MLLTNRSYSVETKDAGGEVEEDKYKEEEDVEKDHSIRDE